MGQGAVADHRGRHRAGCRLAALGWLGVCPVVKRIWTPSWVLFSGGWCFLLLAAFYLLIDLWGRRRWAFPLVVIGMNSIAAYCMAHMFDNFIVGSLHTHLGADPLTVFGAPYERLVQGTLVLFVMWLLLYWMYPTEDLPAYLIPDKLYETTKYTKHTKASRSAGQGTSGPDSGQ